MQKILMGLISLSVWSLPVMAGEDESRWIVDSFDSIQLAFEMEKTDLEGPPPPGATTSPVFRVKYPMSGGCEKHITNFEITKISLIGSTGHSQTVAAKIRIVDSTESRRYDACRARIDVEASLTSQQLVDAVRVFNKKNSVIDALKEEGNMTVHAEFENVPMVFYGN